MATNSAEIEQQNGSDTTRHETLVAGARQANPWSDATVMSGVRS